MKNTLCKEYRLKIRSDGKVMYYCEDGRFWNIRENRQAKPKHFSARKEALAAYDRWAQQNPSDASDWLPRVEGTKT